MVASRCFVELQKANLGEVGAQIEFAWDDDVHLFVGRTIANENAFDRKYRERQELDGIVDAMRAVTSTGDFIPAATTGPRTAHHVRSAQPQMPESLRSGAAAKRHFWHLNEQLRALHMIHEDSIRRKCDRHSVRVLVLSSGNRGYRAMRDRTLPADGTQPATAGNAAGGL